VEKKGNTQKVAGVPFQNNTQFLLAFFAEGTPSKDLALPAFPCLLKGIVYFLYKKVPDTFYCISYKVFIHADRIFL